MLKKVDTIENKNIDENQLMAEKIVDIINGYGVENCGLRISNGIILVSTINKYRGLTYSASIHTGKDTFTSIVIDLDEQIYINNEAERDIFLNMIYERNDYYAQKHSGKNISQGIGVNKNYKFEMIKNEVVKFNSQSIVNSFVSTVNEFIEEVDRFEKFLFQKQNTKNIDIILNHRKYKILKSANYNINEDNKKKLNQIRKKFEKICSKCLTLKCENVIL